MEQTSNEEESLTEDDDDKWVAAVVVGDVVVDVVGDGDGPQIVTEEDEEQLHRIEKYKDIALWPSCLT